MPQLNLHIFGGLIAVVLLFCLSQEGDAQSTQKRVVTSLNPLCHSNPPVIYELLHQFAWHLGNTGFDKNTWVVRDSTRIRLAIRIYTNIIKSCSFPYIPYGSRGMAHFRLGDYDAAYADYQSALAICPEDAWTLSNIGYIYFIRNELPQAEQAYRDAVTYDPDFLDARRNLGVVYAMKRQFQEAIDEWKTGLNIEPDNATLLFYIGSAYKDMGQEEESKIWLEQAYSINPVLRK